MEAKDHNYGVAEDAVVEEEDDIAEEQGSVTMTTQEERTWSVPAYLSSFLGANETPVGAPSLSAVFDGMIGELKKEPKYDAKRLRQGSRSQLRALRSHGNDPTGWGA